MAETANKCVTLLIWDADGSSPEGDWHTILWRSSRAEDDPGVNSVSRIVEESSDALRRKYLAWIYDLGETPISGKRVVDHLEMSTGFSYWWMTLLVEKSPYKSPISDAIRLLALDEIVIRQKPGKLRLVSANRQLHDAVSGLCRRLNIVYEWERQAGELPRAINSKAIYRAMPQPAQALIALTHHVWTRWPLKRAQKPDWFEGERSLFFCSYFDNVDPQSAEQGRFHSYYWGGLHSLLHRSRYHSNWLQLYVPCAQVPTPRIAVNWVRQFNHAPESQGRHAFLDAHLSWRIILRVVKRWLWLNLAAWRLRRIKHAFHPKDTQVSLWPLMRTDWYSSLLGAPAINNLLSMELFDAALRALPLQKKGLYLCENQSWERALVHSWRKHGHGCLIGVAHSTVRFWDMRYFSDPRTIRGMESCSMPQPDLIALNGQIAVDAYLEAGYPKENIVECEALRYGYLSGLKVKQRSSSTRDHKRKVLVLGDVMSSSTDRLLKLLEASISYGSDGMSYAVKLHPNCPVSVADFPSLNIEIVTDPLGTILQDYDVAYASNSTSAAVDAYLAGLPVVVVLDEAELNFSPLRGRSGVRFVSTPEKLADALRMEDQCAAGRSGVEDFFFLNQDLPRWSRLLAS